jgi:hypothetical protein
MKRVQEGFATQNFPLIWGHLRNLVDFDSVVIPRSVRLVGTVCGEFPVDAYSPIFLEIAKENKREDLSGRFNCSGSTAGQALYTNFWHPVRSIPLPLFENESDLNVQELKQGYCQLLKEWYDSSIPDNLPCAAIALKTHGNYCDEREAQRVDVLLVYPNFTARLMSLDFFEGGMDDCISPEWYLSASKLMSLENAFQKISEVSQCQSELQRVCTSIFVKPNFLGDILSRGKQIETSKRKWGFEWTYKTQTDCILDFNDLLDDLQSFFDS